MNKNIHYVLENSLTLLGINMLLGQCFMQTLCFSYFTELILGSFGNGTVNKSTQYVLETLKETIISHYVTNQKIKADTMC